jgi:ABC-2 type transport system permease protein
MGGLFGSIGARVANQAERPVIAVVAPPKEFQRLAAARDQMAEALGDSALVKIVGFSPETDLAAQQKRLLASRSPPVRAVLSGGLDHPHLTGALGNDPATLGQLKLLIANARAGGAEEAPDLPIT